METTTPVSVHVKLLVLSMGFRLEKNGLPFDPHSPAVKSNEEITLGATNQDQISVFPGVRK